MAPEGPYGDHTGYYNEVDGFPVFTITHMTMRKDAIYHSTTPDARRMNQRCSGVALNEVFVPLLRKQFPEIIDFYLPPEGCSYRMAVVTISNVIQPRQTRDDGVWSSGVSLCIPSL